MLERQSTCSLIGDRYLDTQHSLEYLRKLELELARRGMKGARRWFYEYLAASAFWWNIIWWEWCSLNERDLIIGWAMNFVFFGIMAVLASVFLHWYLGVSTFFILHVATVKIGFSLRNGSIDHEAD